MARTPGTQAPKKAAEIAEVRSKGGIFGGVTASDCVYLFHMDRRTILGKIGDLKPSGHNSRGSPLYALDKIAPRLIPPISSPEQIEEYISRMNPRDLPPLLQKEFWNGKRARQKFEEDEGDLWRTDRVMETVANMLKTVRMNLILVPDTLERRGALSEKQRETVQETIDATLQDIRKELLEQFQNEDGQDDRNAHDKFDEAEDDYDDVFDDLGPAEEEL